MTALSIAEAEQRLTANPQVRSACRGRENGPGPRSAAARASLASVTDLSTATVRRNGRRAEIPPSAGVSRQAHDTPAVPRDPRAAAAHSGMAPALAAVPRDPARRQTIRSRQPGVQSAARPAAGQALAAHQAGARPAAGPVRLTARGRRLAAVLAVSLAALALCAFSLIAADGAAAASHGGAHQGMRPVVVEPGQTLWSVASAAEPRADPQSVVQQIMQANSLTGTVIQAGQVLWVPRG
jgi:hypothetical protein